ncbi:uncharacterized protein LOC104685506 [Corvus cornix cornix]|uniref:uncharacterized protein LOC104685506 n=1 Tax=Corvus cornix cornix TaxID=932674 RepID=UPI000901FDD0|nr:uncharacterized protein LOC104685506 [Corvus cornix cornix]
MEHDLLQNVMERVWLLLPSQGCSTQFLHEGMKLPPPLFPPSLFHLPCAGSSVPVGELGGFTKPPKCSRRRSWRKASPGVRRRYQQNHADGTVARIEGGQLPWCEAKREGQESEQLAPHRNPPSLPEDSRGASPPHALALRLDEAVVKVEGKEQAAVGQGACCSLQCYKAIETCLFMAAGKVLISKPWTCCFPWLMDTVCHRVRKLTSSTKAARTTPAFLRSHEDHPE